MKYASILPLVVVLAAAPVLGQENFTRSLSIDSVSCPVGLQVRHGAGVPTRMNADSNDSPQTGPTVNGPTQGRGAQAPPSLLYQRIHLSLTNSVMREIVCSRLTIHGFSDKWRGIPLSDGAHAPDLAKTIDIVLDVKGNDHASRDLYLSGFSAVTAIDVNSIEYADGSEWHTPSALACTVTPGLIMLVPLQ